MIRSLRADELGKLEGCAREFYGASRFLEEFDLGRFREIWQSLLANGSGVIFVADEDGEMAGALGGIVHREIYGESIVAEELFWFVRAAARGAAGPRLYRHFESWASGKGASTVQMCHLADVMPAKVGAFYQRQGFELVETRYAKRLTAR